MGGNAGLEPLLVVSSSLVGSAQEGMCWIAASMGAAVADGHPSLQPVVAVVFDAESAEQSFGADVVSAVAGGLGLEVLLPYLEGQPHVVG